jgi:molecular chaperone GrpE
MVKHFSHNKTGQSLEGEGTGCEPEGAADSVAESRGADTAQDNPPNQAGTEDRAPGTEAGNGAEAGLNAGGAPAAGEADSGPDDRVAGLEAQLAEAKDQFLRKAADFENFRKRMNREKQDAIDFANQSLLLDLIPILDDFDRAIQSAESSQDFDALYEGVAMIAKRLSSTLESKWGLKSYVSAGAAFDPNFHEALMMEKSSAVTEQIVQTDLLKGYTLKDRVIRSAKVKVLAPDPSAPAIAAPVGAPEETADKAQTGQQP